MTFKHRSLRQHELTIALLAAFWGTACGGSFSGDTGAASGAGAGGSGAASGAGSGGMCNVECVQVECDGVLTMAPGECCPVCVPYGTGGAGDGGAGGCSNTACPAYACGSGYKPQTLPGECCPSCVPDDSCAQGQADYSTLRRKLLAQPGAVACKVDNDCALLPGSSYCGDQCSQIPVNAAAAQSIESQLSSFGSSNCSTCTPIYPPCTSAFSPVCTQGQCVSGYAF
ncbi:MAG: hypothetical protein ABI488_27245 [Polyangiaceae bacterium]